MESQPYFVKNLKTNNIVQITGGNAHYFSKTVPNNPDEVYLDADYQIIGKVELSVPEVDEYLEQKLEETQKRIDDVVRREVEVLEREDKSDKREKDLDEREKMMNESEKSLNETKPEKIVKTEVVKPQKRKYKKKTK